MKRREENEECRVLQKSLFFAPPLPHDQIHRTQRDLHSQCEFDSQFSE